jgi:cell division control protein 6
VYGVTGTGKTLITNLVFEKLSQGIDNTYYVFVKCNEYTTQPAIVKYILNQITGIENTNIITDNLAKIKKLIEGKLMVLILDEVDLFLKKEKSNENLIQIFSDWNNTVMVFVSNDPAWHRFILDHRTISRLHRTNMIFRPYTADEIFQILQDRAAAGIRDGAISDEMINEISRFTSQYNGDARIGVKLLSKAAELAELRGNTQIDIDVIKEAIACLEVDNKISFIRTLPPQHRLLLVSLFLAHQNIGIPDFEKVYDEYINLAQRSTSFKKLTRNTVQIYINELCTYNLIKKQFGKGRGRGKGRESTLLFPDFDIDKFQNEIIDSITF